jgi:hypothetical protein
MIRCLLTGPFAAGLLLLAGVAGDARAAERVEAAQTAAAATTPWALPAPPPTSVYDGPLFALSHAYPAKPVAPPDPAPWRVAIDMGRIDTGNAGAYTQALKDHIAADMRVLLFDYANWDAGRAGWYNMPWLAPVREPIHGTYVGSSFPKGMFPVSGLGADMSTHVLVYYDAVSASMLQAVWGADGMTPQTGIAAGSAQYPEGSIIVKPAFTTAGPAVWAPMQGAYPWTIYAVPGDGTSGAPALQTVYLFQFDIIVKDSVSAPDTGWVFSTLVYDGAIAGDDPWAKMVPLGAMWGNDPTVDSPADCDYLQPGSCPALAETWINPIAPVYAKETLGWGGRLSGPNDGAVDIAAIVRQADGSQAPYPGRLAMSSCMSCHGSAEYTMQSFLLPSPSTCSDDVCAPTVQHGELVYWAPGTKEFSAWFQDRPGTTPMDGSTTALDYGMNLAFKALPSWYQSTGQGSASPMVEAYARHRRMAAAK